MSSEKPQDEPVACFGYGILYPSDDDGDLLKDFRVYRDVAKWLTERHGGTFFPLYRHPDPRIAELESLLRRIADGREPWSIEEVRAALGKGK